MMTCDDVDILTIYTPYYQQQHLQKNNEDFNDYVSLKNEEILKTKHLKQSLFVLIKKIVFVLLIINSKFCYKELHPSFQKIFDLFLYY